VNTPDRDFEIQIAIMIAIKNRSGKTRVDFYFLGYIPILAPHLS